MKLEKGMLITLNDDIKYIVISTIILNKVKYVYLIEEDKSENVKFCSEEIEKGNIKLTEVLDLDLRKDLLKKFIKDMQ